MQFSSQQLSEQSLDEFRQTGDTKADEAIKAIADTNAWKQIHQWLDRWIPGKYMPPLVPVPLEAFLEEAGSLPAFADKAILNRGIRFMSHRQSEIMLLLGFLSLPYCYAAAHGARVLCRTRRIVEDTQRRLAETASFVLQLASAENWENGTALRSIATVRLMHAAIRYHIGAAGEWDIGRWGTPVNQEDMAGTNLAFSSVVLRGLRKTGLALAHEDAHAYMHVWKVTGCLLGVHPALLTDREAEANLLDQRIAARQFRASDEGRQLAAALLKVLKESPQGRYANLLPSYMRMLLGEDIADILALPKAYISADVLSPLFRLLALPNWDSYLGYYTTQPQASVKTQLRRIYGDIALRLPAHL